MAVASPVALAWLSRLSLDWANLANIGEAYGAASAILSGMALAGIVVSLAIQWRQNRINQMYGVAQRHLELVKLALDDPRYLYVDGDDVASDPNAKLKVYANLLVGHWAMAWDLGFMREQTLRRSAQRLFGSGIARSWWARWGQSFRSPRGRRRFFEILNSEFELASPVRSNMMNVMPTARTRLITESESPERSRAYIASAALVAGVVVGAVVHRFASRSDNCPRSRSR